MHLDVRCCGVQHASSVFAETGAGTGLAAVSRQGRASLTQWEKTGRKQTSKQIMSGVMSAVKKEAG